MYKQKQILLRQKYKLWSQKGSQYSDPNHFLGTIPSQLQKETYELLIPYHLLQSQLPATPKRWQLAEGTWCSTIHSSNSKIFSFFFRRKKEKKRIFKKITNLEILLEPHSLKGLYHVSTIKTWNNSTRNASCRYCIQPFFEPLHGLFKLKNKQINKKNDREAI